VLSTIHQAKGLEWSHVFVPRLIEESFPHRRAIDEPGGLDEERRIFYVAVTRAKNELTLTYPLTIALGGRGPSVFTQPSRFLTEIDPSLIERGAIERSAETEIESSIGDPLSSTMSRGARRRNAARWFTG
jgi:DNA helicase-2/ATP-dependent DNA helicase PcrA